MTAEPDTVFVNFEPQLKRAISLCKGHQKIAEQCILDLTNSIDKAKELRLALSKEELKTHHLRKQLLDHGINPVCES